jgi:hypothetical protein
MEETQTVSLPQTVEDVRKFGDDAERSMAVATDGQHIARHLQGQGKNTASAEVFRQLKDIFAEAAQKAGGSYDENEHTIHLKADSGEVTIAPLDTAEGRSGRLISARGVTPERANAALESFSEKLVEVVQGNGQFTIEQKSDGQWIRPKSGNGKPLFRCPEKKCLDTGPVFVVADDQIRLHQNEFVNGMGTGFVDAIKAFFLEVWEKFLSLFSKLPVMAAVPVAQLATAKIDDFRTGVMQGLRTYGEKKIDTLAGQAEYQKYAFADQSAGKIRPLAPSLLDPPNAPRLVAALDVFERLHTGQSASPSDAEVTADAEVTTRAEESPGVGDGGADDKSWVVFPLPEKMRTILKGLAGPEPVISPAVEGAEATESSPSADSASTATAESVLPPEEKLEETQARLERQNAALAQLDDALLVLRAYDGATKDGKMSFPNRICLEIAAREAAKAIGQIWTEHACDFPKSGNSNAIDSVRNSFEPRLDAMRAEMEKLYGENEALRKEIAERSGPAILHLDLPEIAPAPDVSEFL